jgi:prepilin-type N-terminal cleavage/methylation domain-containing protein
MALRLSRRRYKIPQNPSEGRMLRSATPPARGSRNAHLGFTLVETVIALAIVAIGFLGSLAAVAQAGKLASAAEEDALAASGLEQRLDQLRLLQWPDLTSTTGVTGNVWTARPTAMAGITVAQETLTISGYDVPAAKTLQATWIGTLMPTAAFAGAGPDLNTASAVKVVATLTWTGRRSARVQTRSSVTVISRGGISKSDLP